MNASRADALNSTSSSNESVSSLSSRDVNVHSNYSAITPQKNKRGAVGKMNYHFASSYQPHETLLVFKLYFLFFGRFIYLLRMREFKLSNTILYKLLMDLLLSSRRVRTLYACLGENDGELSFEPNQIITNGICCS